MIRKWLKFNTCFFEILKNSTTSKNVEQKWINDYSSCTRLPSSYSLCNTSTSSSLTSIPSTGNVRKSILLLHPISDTNDRGDAQSQYSDSDDSEKAVAETPARTELFEVKGPKGSAFLIEVHAKDLEEVRSELVRLKGDIFHFDKAVIEWFVIKCILAVEPFSDSKGDQARLAKVHAISSGSEEVYEGDGKFFFVNSIDKTMRAKRILEKFGYKVTGILYRFQPKEKINLDDRLQRVCSSFVKAVERIPKVISITHNL